MPNASVEQEDAFSFELQFWWVVQWPDDIADRIIRFLSKDDKHLIPSTLWNTQLSSSDSLVPFILAWEGLPEDSRPCHPTVLSWTDNTTAEYWTRRIAGLKGSQGRALARIFAHLLMFSNVGTKTAYI